MEGESEDWRKMIFSYDNVCHLDNLRLAREPLPLPGDHKDIWRDITKTIDEFKTADAEQNITLKWLKPSRKPQTPCHASRLLHG